MEQMRDGRVGGGWVKHSRDGGLDDGWPGGWMDGGAEGWRVDRGWTEGLVGVTFAWVGEQLGGQMGWPWLGGWVAGWGLTWWVGWQMDEGGRAEGGRAVVPAAPTGDHHPPDDGGEELSGEDVGTVEGGGQRALPDHRKSHAQRLQLWGRGWEVSNLQPPIGSSVTHQRSCIPPTSTHPSTLCPSILSSSNLHPSIFPTSVPPTSLSALLPLLQSHCPPSHCPPFLHPVVLCTPSSITAACCPPSLQPIVLHPVILHPIVLHPSTPLSSTPLSSIPPPRCPPPHCPPSLHPVVLPPLVLHPVVLHSIVLHPSTLLSSIPPTIPPPVAPTRRHSDVGEDADAGERQGARLGHPPPHAADGQHRGQLCRDVHRPKDQLAQVDVHPEALQIHGQPVVGEAGGEPAPKTQCFNAKPTRCDQVGTKKVWVSPKKVGVGPQKVSFDP